MIVLDTHIWVWWTNGDERLTGAQVQAIRAHEDNLIGISAISCWEVARLVEYGRLQLPLDALEWLDKALAYPGVYLLPLTPQVAVESTRLPGSFHRDPADQIIVATARVFGCPLITSDDKILNYPHVATIH